MGLYGDLEPSDVPAYSKTEVALYLQLAKSTVGAWTRGTTYSGPDGGRVFFYPVIAPADSSLLSFRGLVLHRQFSHRGRQSISVGLGFPFAFLLLVRPLKQLPPPLPAIAVSTVRSAPG